MALNASVSFRRNRGINFCSPLYSLPPRFCFFFYISQFCSFFFSSRPPLGSALFLPFVALFFSLTSSVSLRRNRGTKVCLFSPLPRFCDHQWLFGYAPPWFCFFLFFFSVLLLFPWVFRVLSNLPPVLWFLLWFFSSFFSGLSLVFSCLGLASPLSTGFFPSGIFSLWVFFFFLACMEYLWLL